MKCSLEGIILDETPHVGVFLRDSSAWDDPHPLEKGGWREGRGVAAIDVLFHGGADDLKLLWVVDVEHVTREVAWVGGGVGACVTIEPEVNPVTP